jgi:hypothetical protein
MVHRNAEGATGVDCTALTIFSSSFSCQKQIHPGPSCVENPPFSCRCKLEKVNTDLQVLTALRYGKMAPRNEGESKISKASLELRVRWIGRVCDASSETVKAADRCG